MWTLPGRHFYFPSIEFSGVFFPIPGICSKISEYFGKIHTASFLYDPLKKNTQWIIARSFSYFPICRKNNGKIILRFFVQFSFLIQTTKVNMKNYGKKNCCVEIYVIIFYITNEISRTEMRVSKILKWRFTQNADTSYFTKSFYF